MSRLSFRISKRFLIIAVFYVLFFIFLWFQYAAAVSLQIKANKEVEGKKYLQAKKNYYLSYKKWKIGKTVDLYKRALQLESAEKNYVRGITLENQKKYGEALAEFKKIDSKLNVNDTASRIANLENKLKAFLKVNDKVVTKNDFELRYNYFMYFCKKVPNENCKKDEENKKKIVDVLIEKVLIEEFAASKNITVGSDEVEAEFQKTALESGGPNEVAAVLKELYGMTINDFKKLIHEQLLVEKVQKDFYFQDKYDEWLNNTKKNAKVEGPNY